MMRFLFVDTERVWRGGQDQLLTLLQGLSRRGHKVRLACYPGTLLETRARDHGIEVYPVAIRRETSLLALFRMVRVLAKCRPEILAFNTPRPIFIGNLASRFVPVRARIIFRRVNFPLKGGYFTRFKYTWGIDGVVAISESIRSQLLLGGLPSSLIRTIYEGMDLTSYPRRPLPNLHQPGDPVVVGTVAHLSAEKGLRFLVEAATLIPDARSRLRFVVVGEGECRQELESLVEEKELASCFHFAGFQNRPAYYMGSFDMFVLPSLSEGLSSAILTAMACSLPVIATNVGGIPELVVDGLNGLLVPPKDPVALAQAIRSLADDPDRCFRMGQRGRERVEERFTLERKILETEELCRSFLSGRQAKPDDHA
ncbi:MAG: glycosyltransferase [Acidobacteria bacterium]|nr:glycosyltransferase [Acidobacteriota bacterium]